MAKLPHSETGQMAGEEGSFPGFPGQCRDGRCTLGCSHLSLTGCRNSARSWPGSSGEFREGSRAATAGTEQAPSPTPSLHQPPPALSRHTNSVLRVGLHFSARSPSVSFASSSEALRWRLSLRVHIPASLWKRLVFQCQQMTSHWRNGSPKVHGAAKSQHNPPLCEVDYEPPRREA